MSFLSLIPALVCVLIALAVCEVLQRKFGAPDSDSRNLPIDGLRGYLAFFVFLHHAYIWQVYIKTGVWTYPASRIFMHFGPTSVAVFFMITGYLFTSKILDARARQINWTRLFVGRIARLMPMYVVAGLLLFAATAVVSRGGALALRPAEHAKNIIEWMTFGRLGIRGANVSVDGVDFSHFLASVTWSLPYEWFFYFSLPVFALVLGDRPKFLPVALGCAGLFALYRIDPTLGHQIYFLAGAGSCLLVRHKWFTFLARTRLASLAILLLISATVAFHATPWGLTTAPVLLGSAFCLVAGGNSLFGALTATAPRLLGEISYSMYLLHGAMLWILFNYLVGMRVASALPATLYWAVVVLLTPILVIICYGTFRAIEAPAIAYGRTVGGALSGLVVMRHGVRREA